MWNFTKWIMHLFQAIFPDFELQQLAISKPAEVGKSYLIWLRFHGQGCGYFISWYNALIIPQLSLQYSRWRTSKVTYINEKLDVSADKISQNIELVTKCVLSNHKYDSENFQVSKKFGLFHIWTKEILATVFLGQRHLG